jgi:MoaA/NifB/PqqE/SkfB family radical SAM enzyme
MIRYEEITSVHLELSTNCNASCPLCPRNVCGADYNAGYPITELTLADIKQIFDTEFILQLKWLLINGNLGDFMLAREGLEIVEYFKQINPELPITISTNGSARTTSFWERLGSLKLTVEFCLDGLEDTHSIYRKDTNFNTIIKNAQSFMSTGGIAHWKFIEFDHNKHQIDQCRILSASLGFSRFSTVDHGRSNSKVYNKKGEYLYSMGSQIDPRQQSISDIVHWTTVNSKNKEHYRDSIKSTITCDTKKNKMIYVAANGDVSPCCYLGFYPQTYETGLMTGNDEIKLMLDGVTNNAREHSLRECIGWFNRVEESWKKESFESGRLWRCNHHCGS